MKQPPQINIQLIHIQGPLKGVIQELSEPVITIGRHPSSHLLFPTDLTTISRNHAEIIREGNRFKLLDHSTNGTFVNGKRVNETYLKSGDVLMFAEGGPKVSFLTQIKEVQVREESKIPQSLPVEREAFAAPPVAPPNELCKKQHRSENLCTPSMEKVKAPLIIQYGPTLRSFNELPITIGKNPHCDFPIDSPFIKDQHAQILFSENTYWVKDLTGGQGSIFINQQPVTKEIPLNENDELVLSADGPVFHFLGEGRLAEVQQPSPAEQSTPEDEKMQKTPDEHSNSVFHKLWSKLAERKS
ncbi:MAG: FHA domain-containing protein [bacterium]